MCTICGIDTRLNQMSSHTKTRAPAEVKSVVTSEEDDKDDMTTMVNRNYRAKGALERSAVPPGHPLAHLGYEGARHMIAERMPSAKRERPVSLRVVDLNKDTVENVKALAATLRRLDLSSLHLVRLSDDFLADLTALERLDVSNNELTEDSFPPSCKNLEKLVELSAHANMLTQFPKGLRRLRNVARLKLGNNKLSTLDGIEKLKKLQVLVVEHNNLTSFPREYFSTLKKIELLHCANNRIPSLHPDIRQLRYLRDLDVSNNQLVVLPPEILLLPRIEVINASGNHISRMPSINVKGRVIRKLASVDLSGNLIVKFPEHLLYLTNRIDLSRNKIKVIPASTFKKLDLSSSQEVMLQENPLTSPPEDVCNCGLRAIMHYFQEEKAHMKIYQGLKVLVLGDTNQGKTSLVQTIVDQQSRLTEVEDRTIGVDCYDYTIDIAPEPTVNAYVPPEDEDGDSVGDTDTQASLLPQDIPLNLSIFDFSGNRRYLFPHYFFLHQPSLVMLVFDLSTYDDSKFLDQIGSWFDYIIARTNKMVILPVGTHVDKLKPKQIKEKCQRILTRMTEHLENHRKQIQKEIKKIENRPHISPALSEQLKLFLNLLKFESYVHDRVIPVSSLNMTGMDDLLKSIETIATRKEIFPNVLREIPSLWGEVENYVEDRGYAMKIPYLSWPEFFEQVTKKFGMKHLMQNITQYLHDTGKVVWYSDHPTLKEFVFLRPSWIMEVFKPIFRHDILELDYSVEESFKQCGIGTSKFDAMKQETANEGIIDREYLKSSLAHMIPTDVNKPLFDVAAIFLQQFELGYPLAKTGRDRLISTASNKTDNQKLDVGSPVRRHTDKADSSRDTSSPGLSRRIPEVNSPTARRHADVSSPSSARRERVDSASTTRSSRPESGVGRPGSSTSKAGSAKGEKDEKAPKDSKAEPQKFNKIIIPWLRKTKDPPARFNEEYGKLAKYPVLTATFSFPYYIPPGFFETLTVRASKPEYNIQMLFHWRTGFYARHLEKPLRFFLERIEHEEGGTCIRVEARHNRPTGEVERETETLWSILLPFLKDAEDLAAKYAGIHMERYMECPECQSLSFLGEWLTPKELQGMNEKQCEACKKNINTVYLVQPKDKRRVEDFLLQKLAKEADSRKQNRYTIQEEEEGEERDLVVNGKLSSGSEAPSTLHPPLQTAGTLITQEKKLKGRKSVVSKKQTEHTVPAP